MPEYPWRRLAVDMTHWFTTPLASMFRDKPLDERINCRLAEQQVRAWMRRQPDVSVTRR